MDLRHTIRKKDGKVHRYWTLVRSVRVGRRVIRQTVAQLGELERGRIAARTLACRLIGAPEEAPLFDDGGEQLTAPVRLKGVRIECSRQIGDVCPRSLCGAGWGLRTCAGGCLQWARNGSHGRRWRRCWWRLGCASRRASCTLPRTGIVARRLAICCSLAKRRSTRIGSIARSIACSRTRRRWRRIYLRDAESCLRSRTTCCSMTSPAPIFEGQAEANPQAQRGYSRDHRPDCNRCASPLS
jgi:hypothetical protein